MRRRWEVWVVTTVNGEPNERLQSRCFTKLGALFAQHVMATDRLTPKMIALWNEKWPDEQLGLFPRYEVRRAS